MIEKKLVQFGAGNIGRSFIGQVFSRAGYEVVFIDIDKNLIDALNRKRKYRVIIKKTNQSNETIWVHNVRGVNGKNRKAVIKEIATAQVLATAVGKNILAILAPDIAAGLIKRHELYGEEPLDIIMAENVRNAADFMRKELSNHLPQIYPIDKLIGLVESSIGKMVPIMKEEDLAEDPLWVFAEEYNELILDKKGFQNPIPAVKEISAKENMSAWMDRKLFIHNLGHAATAYFTFKYNPDLKFIYQGLAIPEIYLKVINCMRQSAAALHAEYPGDLSLEKLEKHINDLLMRFTNQSLGDTVFRVGRDLQRKLGKDDRLIGALLLAKKHKCPCDMILQAVKDACFFKATDDDGNMFDGDLEFTEKIIPKGLKYVLKAVSHLSENNPLEFSILKELAS